MEKSTRSRRRRGLPVFGLAGLAAILGVALLVGTGAAAARTSSSSRLSAKSSAAKTNVTFLLNITPGGAQSGFMYGKALGIFSKAGININIVPGQGSVTTSELVATGKDDIGYADPAAAFAVAAKGGNIVVVTPILEADGYALISLKSSGITSVKDVKGKTVGITPGTAETELFSAVLGKAGLSTSSVKLDNIAEAAVTGALRDGTVQAIASAGDQQGPSLAAEGVKLNEQFFYANGVPTVGESIVVNKQYLKTHGSLVRSFVQASLASWVATHKNPRAAAAAEVKQFPTAGTVAQIYAQTKVDIGLLCAAKGSTEMGQVPNAIWSNEQTILEKYDSLPKSFNVTKAITTAYEPAAAPSCS